MTKLFGIHKAGTRCVVGLFAAMGGTRVRLQVQVWWTRRKALFLITVLVAALVWLGCESGFFTRSPLGAIAAAFRSNLPGAQPAADRGFLAGLDFYLPILSLYEFLIVLLAAEGAVRAAGSRRELPYAWTRPRPPSSGAATTSSSPS